MSVCCPITSYDTGVNLKDGTGFSLPSAWKGSNYLAVKIILISLSDNPNSHLISGYYFKWI